MRITNNEEQIMNISRALNREYEKVPTISENLYNLSIRKEERQAEFIERGGKEKGGESAHFPAFHPAP